MRTRSGKKYDYESSKVISNKIEIDIDISKKNKSKNTKSTKKVVKIDSMNILIELFSSNLFIQKNENDLDDEMDFIANKFSKSCSLKNNKRKKYPMLGKKRRKKKKS